MENIFVKAVFELDCDWEGLAPIYRIYVGDELFTERTFDFTNSTLTETLQIQAAPGTYKVRLEPQRPNLATFRCHAHRIEHGTAHWADADTLVITAS